MGPPQMTLQTQAVLNVLLDKPTGEHYGLELARAVGLASGTLYPILARLERAGWVVSEWEQIDEREAGRPRRRYYKLTGAGALSARQALDDTLRKLAPRRSSTRLGWAGGR